MRCLPRRASNALIGNVRIAPQERGHAGSLLRLRSSMRERGACRLDCTCPGACNAPSIALWRRHHRGHIARRHAAASCCRATSHLVLIFLLTSPGKDVLTSSASQMSRERGAAASRVCRAGCSIQLSTAAAHLPARTSPGEQRSAAPDRSAPTIGRDAPDLDFGTAAMSDPDLGERLVCLASGDQSLQRAWNKGAAPRAPAGEAVSPLEMITHCADDDGHGRMLRNTPVARPCSTRGPSLLIGPPA